jgi:hypothetical protein
MRRLDRETLMLVRSMRLLFGAGVPTQEIVRSEVVDVNAFVPPTEARPSPEARMVLTQIRDALRSAYVCASSLACWNHASGIA